MAIKLYLLSKKHNQKDICNLKNFVYFYWFYHSLSKDKKGRSKYLVLGPGA